MIYIGIDPGLSGAWAAIDHNNKFVACGDIKAIDRRVVAKHLKKSILGALEGIETAQIVVELVHAMPNQGVTSMFSFGHACGVIAAVCELLNYPTHYVTPQCWKKHHGLINTDKKDSLILARKYWPDAPLNLVKHHGRADALLLSLYGLDKLQ